MSKHAHSKAFGQAFIEINFNFFLYTTSHLRWIEIFNIQHMWNDGFFFVMRGFIAQVVTY